MAGPETELEEVQQNEVEALKAIYMDDFEDCVVASAWNIHLKSSEGDNAVGAVIKVTMTATYPRSKPLVSVEGSKNLHAKQKEALREVINKAIKDLAGQEMVFEITSAVQEKLNEYERVASEAAPSLEEERLNRIREQQEREQKVKEELRRQKEEESLEEDRMLGVMVREELNRRKTQRERLDEHDEKNIEASGMPPICSDQKDAITLDRVVAVRRTNGSVARFRQVRGKIRTHTEFDLGAAYVVKPYTAPSTPADKQNDIDSKTEREDDPTSLQLLLWEFHLDSLFWRTSEARKPVHDLESELEALKELRHEYIVPLYEWKIYRNPNQGDWTVHLLTGFSQLGSITSLLDTVGSVSIKVARGWGIQILEALDFIHKAGFVHKSLSADNVILFRRDLGETVVRVSMTSYGYRLQDMNRRNPFNKSDATDSSLSPVEWNSGWDPPERGNSGLQFSRKSDIWAFGVVFVQMICGKSVLSEFENPRDFLASSASENFSSDLHEFLSRIFRESPKKRPTAFDLLPSPFLRSLGNGAEQAKTNSNGSVQHGGHIVEPSRQRSRSLSNRSFMERERLSTPMASHSRYLQDFEEVAVLGRGAYGEVVKARNRLDGRVYAIKKIQATADKLTHILQEVWLLSRLNHQYVVRYFTAWLEDEDAVFTESAFSDEEDDDADEETEQPSESDDQYESRSRSRGHINSKSGRINSFYNSIDFMSNSMADFIEFASDSEAEGEEEDDRSESLKDERRGKRTYRQDMRSSRRILYIQMEYCEKHTLADLIHDNLYTRKNEYWRLFRQLLEALAYIHGQGVIHRDLKPMNIFIDQAQNIKIGDFGLAKSIVQEQLGSNVENNNKEDMEDLTGDVGTTLYVANEVTNKNMTSYNEKVDMYSLGIIFFEMVYPMSTGMERISIIRRLRLESIEVPEGFMAKRYDVEREIVRSLLDHIPNNRPSARELLQSGMVPLLQEDEAVRQVLQSLVDPNSPWLYAVCNALFSRPLPTVQQILYDRKVSGSLVGRNTTGENDVMRTQIVGLMRQIFECHGAVDTNDRSHIFPRSSNYENHVVELMDRVGNIVQLPYDLTLPYARRLAERMPEVPKSYTFGTVFRGDDRNRGVHPLACGEVDFDIVSMEKGDLALQDAEVLRVLDELGEALGLKICIYLNHSEILKAVLDFCSVKPAQINWALKLVGQTGQGPIRASVRDEVLERTSLTATILSDIEQFGFRDNIDRAETKMSKLMDGLESRVMKESIAHIRTVIGLARRLGLKSSIYFAPLSNYNWSFYEGIMFQATIEDTMMNTSRKRKTTSIIAAGGRYDRLIRRFRHSSLDNISSPRHGVGFNLALDKVVEIVKNFNSSSKSCPNFGLVPSRCDVLVTSFSPANINGMCLDVLRELWSNGIRAELVRECYSTEGLVSNAQRENVTWIVIVKQLHASNTSANYKPLRLKNLTQKRDLDLGMEELVATVLIDVAGSDRKASVSNAGITTAAPAVGPTEPSDSELGGLPVSNRSNGGAAVNNVNILPAHGKIKGGKKKLWELEDTARRSLEEYLTKLEKAPLYSIEVKDEVLDAIIGTAPDQIDEWRRRVVGASPTNKAYLFSLGQVLAREKARGTKIVGLHSSKTNRVAVYDLSKFT